MSISYYEVLVGTGGPDFGGTGTPIVANGSGLGPDGLPIVTGGVADIGPSSQLTWWSPALNPAVIATGSGTVSVPFNSNMFAPNSTGTNNNTAFETAVLTGTFSSTGGLVNFTVGSDDDAFVYLNGILIGQNPGIHALTNVTFSGTAINGTNTLEIFYADREQVAAQLSISTDEVLSAVPESSTWAMMILGFLGIGFMAYRRKGGSTFRLA
jgi:hypothetical protein